MPANQPLQPGHFCGQQEVTDCIAELKSAFGEQFDRLQVSDTLDREGHQYVNLVQKGGGVLGVALVGYTYILETVGIRFLRLAGTSAGAINTSLLAVIGKKEERKSETILRYLCELNFFSLVDGYWFARWLIKKILTRTRFEKSLLFFFRLLVISLITLFVLNLAVSFAEPYFSWAPMLARILIIVSLIYLVLLALVAGYCIYLIGRWKHSGYGINPGRFFYQWIKDRMEENGVRTVSDLQAKSSTLPELLVRKPGTQNADTLFGDVTFIASELVSENKIEFPRMAHLFRENVDELHPAGFVRASMSIPIFFESFIIDQIPQTEKIKAAWAECFDPELPVPATARFVDGGILSDFPINIFYNPRIIEPRLPYFGIDLDDSDPSEVKSNQDVTRWSLLNFVGRIFNTIRFYYDKDFLTKNKVFRKGIGKIPLAEFNWLNFFLTDEDKLKMFAKGARAATEFLKQFDWKQYQQDRIAMQTMLNAKQEPEKTREAILPSQP